MGARPECPAWLSLLSQAQRAALSETLGWNYFPFLSAFCFSFSSGPAFPFPCSGPLVHDGVLSLSLDPPALRRGLPRPSSMSTPLTGLDKDASQLPVEAGALSAWQCTVGSAQYQLCGLRQMRLPCRTICRGARPSWQLGCGGRCEGAWGHDGDGCTTQRTCFPIILSLWPTGLAEAGFGPQGYIWQGPQIFLCPLPWRGCYWHLWVEDGEASPRPETQDGQLKAAAVLRIRDPDRWLLISVAFRSRRF